MKSLFRNLVVFACLLMAAVPLAAQEDNLALLDDEGDATVFVPNGWEIMPAADFDDYFAEVEGLDASILTDGTLVAMILTPAQIEALLENDEEVDRENTFSVFFAVYMHVYGGMLAMDEIENTTTGGYQTYISRYAYTTEDDEAGEGEAYWLILDEDANEAFFIDVYGMEGDIEPAREDIDAIIESLIPADDASADEPAEASGEACTVETDTERTATVRVGPGEHRTAITFLKADQPYTVEGRFEGDAADVWYKLVKDEVDPGSSAAELWTSANDVNAIGDCANVGEAAAPPLRPIIEARPTTVLGDTNNSGGGEDPGTTVTGGITPASGTWVFTYNSVVTASCAGGGYGEFPYSELGLPATETINITAAADGSSLTVGGDVFPRINETLFLGDYNFGDSNGQAYLFPQSANSMSLELRANVVINGLSCSATVSGNASRQ